VMHVMAPFDVASMNDDYQDVRVLEARPDLLEFEVVVYPFNTVADASASNRAWRKPNDEAREYLAPGVCCNWDKGMQAELLAALKKDGVDVAELDDVDAAKRVSQWLLDRAKFEDSFTTFAVEFERGVPRVTPRQKANVDETLKRFGRTLQEQWDRELLGAGMFRTRTRGSCTSSAIYLSTGLRAAGIPARTVVCVPIVDSSDDREVAWIDTRIAHRGVRRILKASAAEQRGSWTSHTFNEVLVGGRWRRLNYATLGQNVLDRQFLGLMVHVHTFKDHSEAGLVGWGNREAHPAHAALFGGPNPYSCVSLSDRFGEHAKIVDDGPEPLRDLAIGALYWYDDPRKDPVVSMRLDDPATAGHLIAHVESSLAAFDKDAVREFYAAVDKRFALRAEGRPDVPVQATRGFWLDEGKGMREFYLRIEPGDFAAMESGVEYALAWLGEDRGVRWSVPEGAKGVTISRSR